MDFERDTVVTSDSFKLPFIPTSCFEQELEARLRDAEEQKEALETQLAQVTAPAECCCRWLGSQPKAVVAVTVLMGAGGGGAGLLLLLLPLPPAALD